MGSDTGVGSATGRPPCDVQKISTLVISQSGDTKIDEHEHTFY
jgi:hypothetical protein